MTYLMSFLLGILTALPMTVEQLFFLPWVTLPLWLLLVIKCDRPYRHGLVWSFGYCFITFSWLIELYPMDFAGFSNGMSILIIVLGIVFLTVLQGVGTAFVPFFYKKAYGRIPLPLTPVLAGSLWCVAEWGQTLFWFGVPWGRLALTQTFFLPGIQSASLLGSYFVGFIMMAWAGLLAAAADPATEISGRRLSVKKGFRRAYAAAACAVLLANTVFGAVKLSLPEKSGVSVCAAPIQGNISSTDKWADDSVANSLSVYSALTRSAAESGAQLVVWPETVITVALNSSPGISQYISSLSAETGCDIAAGAFYVSDDDEKTVYNAIYYFHPDGTVSDEIYFKRHPVPFGEYVPMRGVIMKVFPFLDDINMFSDDLGRGEDTSVFRDSRGSVGSIICFDSIYPDLARRSAKDGADLIILPTNDSWYGDSSAVYQHNRHAALRAVENGRYIVRAANTGVSSVIDRNGRMLTTLEPLVDGYVSADVFYETGSTPYTVLGDVIVWISIAVSALCAVYSEIRIIREKHR